VFSHLGIGRTPFFLLLVFAPSDRTLGFCDGRCRPLSPVPGLFPFWAFPPFGNPWMSSPFADITLSILPRPIFGPFPGTLLSVDGDPRYSRVPHFGWSVMVSFAVKPPDSGCGFFDWVFFPLPHCPPVPAVPLIRGFLCPSFFGFVCFVSQSGAPLCPDPPWPGNCCFYAGLIYFVFFAFSFFTPRRSSFWSISKSPFLSVYVILLSFLRDAESCLLLFRLPFPPLASNETLSPQTVSM